MINDGLNNILRAGNLFQIPMRVVEKAAQPFPAALCAREVELMKNRKLFFRVKDRNIVKGDFIYLHDALSLKGNFITLRNFAKCFYLYVLAHKLSCYVGSKLFQKPIYVLYKRHENLQHSIIKNGERRLAILHF